jgi:hypothetical protein
VVHDCVLHPLCLALKQNNRHISFLFLQSNLIFTLSYGRSVDTLVSMVLYEPWPPLRQMIITSPVPSFLPFRLP